MARGDAGTLAAEYIRSNFNDISNYGLDLNKANGLNSDDFRKLLDKADSLVNTVSEINNTNKKADGTLSGSVRVVENNGKLELSTTGEVADGDLKRVTDQLRDVNTSLAAVADRVFVSVQSERAVDSAGNTTDATTNIKITTGISADEVKRRAAETKSRFKQLQNAIAQWQKVLDTDVIETITMLSRSIGSNVLSTFGNSGRQLALNAGMVQHVGALTGRGTAYPLQAIQTANQMLASMGGDQANSMMVGLAASAWGNPASEYRLDRPQLEQRILATYAGNIESDTAKSVGALFSRVYQARKGDKGWTNVDEAIGSFENMKNAYYFFMESTAFYGFACVCSDHPTVKEVISKVKARRVLTYGFQDDARLQAIHIQVLPGKLLFDVKLNNVVYTGFELNMFGRHNILNALAAITIGLELEIPVETIKKALSQFGGVQRRFTKTGCSHGVTVYDDYAHHPVEIAAVLKAAKEASPQHKIVALFQPHRYSRALDLADEFATCFKDADTVIVADIYAAGEKPLQNISKDILVQKIKTTGHPSVYALDASQSLPHFILNHVSQGDIIIGLGAGDISKWMHDLPNQLDKIG